MKFIMFVRLLFSISKKGLIEN